MRWIRIALEHVLLAAFFMARLVLLLQALAFGTAAAATLVAASGAWPDWLVAPVLSTAALSATCFVAGLLLPIARRWEEAPGDEPGGVWPAPFGLTLVLLAGLSSYASSRLPALWQELVTRLSGVIVWEDLSRPAPNAGIVLLPMLIGLLIPVLVTLAALASILLPLALLVLLPNRRPRFMALLAMSVICQTALVIASWLAAHALSGLAGTAVTLMRDSGDAEVMQLADQLVRVSQIIEGTASALIVPALGMAAWLIALRPWRTEPDAPPLSARIS